MSKIKKPFKINRAGNALSAVKGGIRRVQYMTHQRESYLVQVNEHRRYIPNIGLNETTGEVEPEPFPDEDFHRLMAPTMEDVDGLSGAARLFGIRRITQTQRTLKTLEEVQEAEARLLARIRDKDDLIEELEDEREQAIKEGRFIPVVESQPKRFRKVETVTARPFPWKAIRLVGAYILILALSAFECFNFFSAFLLSNGLDPTNIRMALHNDPYGFTIATMMCIGFVACLLTLSFQSLKFGMKLYHDPIEVKTVVMFFVLGFGLLGLAAAMAVQRHTLAQDINGFQDQMGSSGKLQYISFLLQTLILPLTCAFLHHLSVTLPENMIHHHDQWKEEYQAGKKEARESRLNFLRCQEAYRIHDNRIIAIRRERETLKDELQQIRNKIDRLGQSTELMEADERARSSQAHTAARKAYQEVISLLQEDFLLFTKQAFSQGRHDLLGEPSPERSPDLTDMLYDRMTAEARN